MRAGSTNAHEYIPWRTITGRQQFFQDHPWMQAFGEQLMSYRPPINTRTIDYVKGKKSNGNTEIVLNWITPHQKWGIHSTYSDNLIMPMTFLSGVFYSIQSLPPFWQTVSHLNPFFYMIDGFRYGFFGQSDTSPWLSLTIVGVAWMAVSFLAVHLLRTGYKIRN